MLTLISARTSPSRRLASMIFGSSSAARFCLWLTSVTMPCCAWGHVSLSMACTGGSVLKNSQWQQKPAGRVYKRLICCKNLSRKPIKHLRKGLIKSSQQSQAFLFTPAGERAGADVFAL